MENINDTFTSNKAIYHHTCYTNKNQQMFDREKQPPTDSDDGVLSPQRKRAKRANDDKVALEELKCLFCNVSERDKPQNLCAAGTFHAPAQRNNELYDFTEKIKNMALFLDDLEIFS